MKTNSQYRILNLQSKIVNGFTLIELILAVFLLSVLMFSIYSVYSLSLTSYEIGVNELDINSTSQQLIEKITNYLLTAKTMNVNCNDTCIYFTGYYKSGDENKKYWLYLYRNDFEDKWWEDLDYTYFLNNGNDFLFKNNYSFKLQREDLSRSFVYGKGSTLSKNIYFNVNKDLSEDGKFIYEPIFKEGIPISKTLIMVNFQVKANSEKLNLYTAICLRNL